MAFYAFKQIEVGSISAGATASGSWTADDNYTIKKIFIREVTETAVGLQFLNCTLRVDNYTFTKDIISPLGHGLVIAANNIVIDGNNFTIDGVSPGLCEGAGIQRSGIYNPGFDNVTIKNLEIKNFCNGIYLRGDKLTGDYVYENIIENCNIHHNGNAKTGDTSTHGIKLEYTRGCIIKNCSIHN